MLVEGACQQSQRLVNSPTRTAGDGYHVVGVGRRLKTAVWDGENVVELGTNITAVHWISQF